ncbi:50S ribosomal protein L10 [Alicyclobacillus hesperidum URH17-3-68]|uniref:Large ribosomal subunit protein uL10 n=1 Tax=Alicyclobacillus hesperidum TaxID=89784 RepID=A0A1H2VJJ6_9BACL|nr:50S ribosomal protein L10 [Alicyclobacillus hesperidum URH17-3-68]SDW68059.1 LSU ribosomal protein L10P [Alicyclobacillus hesperidum]
MYPLEEVDGLAVRAEKEQLVQSVAERLERSKSVVLADYRGLNVAEDTELRTRLRAAGVEYAVIKNTMTSRAAKQVNLEGLDEFLSGPTAIAFGYEDAVTPAKILHEFAREHKALELKGGVVEGRIVSGAELAEIAKLPSREGLLSMLLSVLQAPMRNLAYVVSQVAEKNGGAGAASEVEAAPAE